MMLLLVYLLLQPMSYLAVNVSVLQSGNVSCAELLLHGGKHCCRDSSTQQISTFHKGEFGIELIVVLPLAYAAWLRGELEATYGCGEVAAFYFFSPNHTDIRHCKRRWTVVASVECAFPSGLNHGTVLADRKLWHPPPLRAHYRELAFKHPATNSMAMNSNAIRPLIAISNKFNTEWGHSPVNYLSIDLLNKTLTLLVKHLFRVVYTRPTASVQTKEFADDMVSPLELRDHELIRAHFPEVLVMEDVAAANPNLSYNEVQLRVFAHARHFICVQGGNAIVAGYFAEGGDIIVLHKEGQELLAHEYELVFQHFDGADYSVARSEAELWDLVQRKVPLWAVL